MAQCETCIFAERDSIGIDFGINEIIVDCTSAHMTDTIYERFENDEDYHCPFHVTAYR